ncbi:MAG TPA: hypothetical protein VF657_14445, partial [Actinoplanes sp.]
MTRSAPGIPELTPAVVVTDPSWTNRCPRTQFTSRYFFSKALSLDQWPVAVRPSSSPAAARTADPLHTARTRAPPLAWSVTQSRRA